MIEAVESVKAMAPYALAEIEPGLTSLAQNESTFPPSPKAVKAATESLSQVALYSDPDWSELTEAIVQNHPCTADQILCGAGSMELIGSIIRAYTGAGDQVVGTAYGYLFVATACQQAGSTYTQAAEVDYRICIDNILAAVTSATRVVFVCNPGNPTGTRVDNAELVKLRQQLPGGVLLVIDQAYAEFDLQDHSSVFELTKSGNTIVTRTFSKAYALAGQRIGWGVFPGHIATQVRKLLNPNNVSMLAQSMAAAAMIDQAYMQSVVSRTVTTRDNFCEQLTGAGFQLPASHTNFVLIPFSHARQARSASQALKNAGYLLRGVDGYGLYNCLRATVGTEDAMNSVAEVLSSGPELPSN